MIVAAGLKGSRQAQTHRVGVRFGSPAAAAFRREGGIATRRGQ